MAQLHLTSHQKHILWSLTNLACLSKPPHHSFERIQVYVATGPDLTMVGIPSWFVMGSSPTTFRVPEPIPPYQIAISTKPFCFLFLTAFINNDEPAFWPETFGLPLTDLPRDDPARMQPSRSGKGKRRTLTDSMQESFDPGLAGKLWD
ncbi:LOW QUALITY PROTEIN: hypothetical protein IFM46972_04679 [Aspergillus udagawae]|uniref:Uncharacterized protein n=1 Tax=Aspergillus udagawae TaxID=91492 RepID=A0A8H3RS09_9EURO|nr:LOW QUALITY PROTEIN: hypothetical protein IFM46972_04679 [Aspergillus udagawae]